MNLQEVKAKCTGVSIGTINLGNEYSLTEEVKWLIEQAEKVEVLENQLENAIFTTYEDPVPKRTFPLKMTVSHGGSLPVAPERY